MTDEKLRHLRRINNDIANLKALLQNEDADFKITNYSNIEVTISNRFDPTFHESLKQALHDKMEELLEEFRQS